MTCLTTELGFADALVETNFVVAIYETNAQGGRD